MTTVNQQDTITHANLGFDGDKYVTSQTEAILERISKFSGRLYLEIGGKFLIDPHASRVLPWFHPNSKQQIFQQLNEKAQILFCVNAQDIIHNRQLSNEDITYVDYTLDMIESITNILQKPLIVINKIDPKTPDLQVQSFIDTLTTKGYNISRRYLIEGYPHDLTRVLSADGYGKDDYVPVNKNLVLVTGSASDSGKMSTCLGQVYLDHTKNIESGYAKYETFPIRNLPLHHPVNLAYEAATADINDYNMIDTYHKKAYNKEAINYNRDVEAFEIVTSIASQFLPASNFTRSYQSPTDMGISMGGFCITNDTVVTHACIAEIERRKARYQQMVDRNEGDLLWVHNCKKLLKEAKKYLKMLSF